MGIELNNDQIFANYALENWWNSGTKNQVFNISGGAGVGKALTNTTIIPTPNGKKFLFEIKKGDYVFDRRGEPTKVLGVYPQGKKEVYLVHLNDERVVECCKDHLFTTIEQDSFSGNLVLKDRTVEEMYKGLQVGEEGYTIHSNYPVKYTYKELDVHPEYYGREVIIVNYTNIEAGVEDDDLYRFIPDEYLYSSYKQRLDLIEGLKMVADIDEQGIEINGKMSPCVLNTLMIGNERLLNNIKELLYSTGFHRVFIKYIDMDDEENEYDIGYWYLTWIDYDQMNQLCSIDKITKTDRIEEMTCIYVDNPEHLFLCNDFVVTHNTTLIMYFIERIGLPLNNVLFTSFTGKAVNVMQRHGLPAKTIHSAIYDYEKSLAKDENGNYIILRNGKALKVGNFVLKDRLPKKIKLIVVDEASMVPENLALDLLSFGIPIVALGDLNQLPPVMGKSYFLKEPDVILRQIMRQAEGNPIIWLANQVLAGKGLKYGVYGYSSVLRKRDLTEFQFLDASIVLTCLNNTRYSVNNYFREDLKRIKQLEYPHVHEKICCEKNNWDECLDGFYLTNGMTGYVDHYYRDSYTKRALTIDFRPDFLNKSYKKLPVNYYHLNKNPSAPIDGMKEKFSFDLNKFGYAYALTCHKFQGSQADKILFLYEDFMNSNEDNRRLLYTGITRAIKQVQIVMV